MRGLGLGVFLAICMLSACSSSLKQALRSDQAASTATKPVSEDQKWQGLVVTDNPYMISSECLEQMNKGGFGGY